LDVAESEGVVTTTLRTPADPAGINAVICVAVTVGLVTGLPPMVTVAPVKFVPVIVSGVPPEVGPEVGLIEAIVGSDALVYVNAPGLVAVPPGVVTATALAPAVAEAGVTAETCVGEINTSPVAVTPPTVTLLALARFVPEIVMVVPPANAPVFGFTDVMLGVGTTAPRNPATLALAALTNL